MAITLALTPGEPAGIGPDLCIQLAQRFPDDVRPVLLADPQLLRERASLLKLPLQFTEYSGGEPPGQGAVEVLPIPLQAPCSPGKPDVRNAAYVLATLERATQGCLSGEFAALVTGPVQKSIIVEAGFSFTGHTEFLAAKSGTARVVMMLAAGSLRVALATTHLPLAEVPGAISPSLLEAVLRILQQDLRGKFGIAEPRILVCGLNPHAGENGHLGREEIEVITPVITQLQDEGMRISGPLPADTLFTPRHLRDADAVLAMYHDQGLPVLKALGFGEAVNITLGLPFIRTSVDHGTALDLAGTGKADPGSLLAAVRMAARLAGNGTRR